VRVTKTGIDDVKGLFSTIHPVFKKWHEHLILFFARIEKGANVAILFECAASEADGGFRGSIHDHILSLECVETIGDCRGVSLSDAVSDLLLCIHALRGGMRVLECQGDIAWRVLAHDRTHSPPSFQ
jgi:hypothetical protein